MRRTFRWCLLALAVLVPHAAGASPWLPAVVVDSSLAAFNTCYATLGNTNPNGGALIRIDLATGAGTLIGATGITGTLGDAGVPALAIRRTGEMFATDIGPSARLYRLDAKSGAATLIGSTALTSPPAMVFDGLDVLYAIDAAGRLYTVNPSTAASTLVGLTGISIKGLAVDPTDGWLWGSDAGGGIYKIDNLTAAATLVGNTGLPASPDLCFDPSGALFGLSGGGLGTNNLISIDKSTAEGSVIGPIGFNAVSGMAIRLDQIVPTLVQVHRATWLGNRVELRWRLTESTGNLAFMIDRAAGAGGYVRLDAAGVSRDGADFVFLDGGVEPGRTYRYRVVVLEDGAPSTSFETSVTAPRMGLALEQNHPNPFRAATRIEYATGEASHVSLTVHDMAGRLVRVLADGPRDAGRHVEAWDGRDARGSALASGVYFYRLRSAGREWTRRMMLLD
jgi:hypothetical protein